MKTDIRTSIVVIFLLMITFSSCSDDDATPAPELKTELNKSLVGHWTFESVDSLSVKADFSIIDFQGQLAVDNESGGNYTTPAGTDQIMHKTPVLPGDSPWYIPILKLQGTGDEKLVFTNGEVSNDLSSITFRSLQYVDMEVPSGVINGDFTITKEKK